MILVPSQECYRGGSGQYGGSSRSQPNRRTYPTMQREERIRLSQSSPSDRWIDSTVYPNATEYQSLLQRIENRFTYDSGITFDEHAEIQALLIQEEDDAIDKARTALQQLVKIQQLKLEAVARSAVSDNHQSDKLPEVYQQTQELKGTNSDCETANGSLNQL